MPFTEAIAIALASLRANKLRSFLTVLGILIGVSSVIAIVAITEGLDSYISDKVLKLGGKSFTLQRLPAIILSREEFIELNKRKRFDLDDVEIVRRGCPDCLEVGAQVTIGGSAKYGRVTQKNMEVIGISENVPRIGSSRDLEAGRHIIEQDVDQAASVTVIGADLREAFFPRTDPIGKEILIDGHPVRVVGLAEKKGSLFGQSQDNFAWLPLTTHRKFYGTRRSVIMPVEARSMAVFEAAQDQVRVAMRVRRKIGFGDPDDFSLETGQTIMDLWQNATRGIYFVTIVVTAISLLVGGIVVMNIMLVSVTERIREIGVRKALGARRRDVMRQFLVESVALSLLGGILGVIGASLFSMMLAAVLGSIMATSFDAPVRLWAVLVAVAASSSVGLVAGLYPASRAASLDPVEALRNE